MSRNVLTEQEAADYIGMSISYLRQDRCYGAIGGRTPGPRFLKYGRAVRYRLSHLEEWLEEHTQYSEQRADSSVV